METVQITLSDAQFDGVIVLGTLFCFVLGWSVFGWAR